MIWASGVSPVALGQIGFTAGPPSSVGPFTPRCAFRRRRALRIGFVVRFRLLVGLGLFVGLVLALPVVGRHADGDDAGHGRLLGQVSHNRGLYGPQQALLLVARHFNVGQ